MNRAMLSRIRTNDSGTIGTLLTNTGYSCITMEPPCRDNARNISCIPTGTYRCGLVHSKRFGTVYHVRGVPGRSGILIHAGNYAGDTSKGLRSHSHGCVLLGRKFGWLAKQEAALLSRAALSEFIAAMQGMPFELNITEQYNA